MSLRIVLALGFGLWPALCFAQTPAQLQAAADAARAVSEAIGQVTAVQGGASVTRNNAAAAPLQKDSEIYRDDVVQTGASGTLSITFDDETTFNLSPNTSVTIDEFIYDEKSKNNAAAFKVARGTVAFVASQVAKTGDMTIATPTATMGIRGTTGLVEVPEGAGSTGAGDARIKLYPDSDGRVGRIEVFAPGQGGARLGQRLGLLTSGSSAFAIRGAGGRFTATPFAIPAQEAARDRGIVQRLYQSHTFGRQVATQRQQLRQQRGPGQQRQPGQRGLQQQQGPGQRGLQQQGPRNQQQNLQQPNLQQPNLQQRNLQGQPLKPNDPRRRRPPDAADQDQQTQPQQQPQIRRPVERRNPQRGGGGLR